METRRQLKALIFLALTAPALPAWAEPLPRDVQHFIDRREGCDQLRVESGRTNEVSREIRKLCGGADQDLVQLKRKYAGNSTIMQILNQFETGGDAAEAATPKSKTGARTG